MGGCFLYVLAMQQILNIALMFSDLQEHKMHDNVSLAKEHNKT